MTAPAFLLASHRACYAEAAAFERDERARLYPARIKEGKIEAGDAEADFAAWVAIARWCAGEPVHLDVSLETMELAAARALAAGEAAVAAAPADAARIARRDQVAGIHSMLSRYRAFLDGLNAALRERALQARAAA